HDRPFPNDNRRKKQESEGDSRIETLRHAQPHAGDRRVDAARCLNPDNDRGQNGDQAEQQEQRAPSKRPPKEGPPKGGHYVSSKGPPKGGHYVRGQRYVVSAFRRTREWTRIDPNRHAPEGELDNEEHDSEDRIVVVRV